MYEELVERTEPILVWWFIFDSYVSVAGMVLSGYLLGKLSSIVKENELPFIKKHIKLVFVFFLSKMINGQLILTFNESAYEYVNKGNWAQVLAIRILPYLLVNIVSVLQNWHFT